MLKRLQVFSLVAAAGVALAGCGGREEARSPAPEASSSPRRSGSQAVFVKGVDVGSIDEAMAAVPRGLRADFGKAMACQTAKPGVKVDAAFVRDLTRRLERDRSLAAC